MTEGNTIRECAALLTDVVYPLESFAQLQRVPLNGRTEVLRRPIPNVGAALQHIEAAAEQVNDIDRWGCRRRYIGDSIPPVIGPSRPAMGRPATGSPPALG